MADLGTSMVIASVIVGMISIPAAAQTVQNPEMKTADLPNISGSESVPKEVRTSSSADSFSRTVSSAFQEFGFTVESDSADAYIEDASARLEVSQKPGSTVWTLETPNGRLEIEKTPQKTVEKVETPSGTLKKVKKKGGIQTYFKGADRQKVESSAERFKAILRERRNRMERKKQNAVRENLGLQQYRSGLKIRVSPESPEYVKISNQMSTPIDMEDWNLTDEVGGHTFKSVEVPGNGELYVYSGEKPSDLEEKSGAEYVYGTGISWNDGGDTATLWKEDQKIVQESY